MPTTINGTIDRIRRLGRAALARSTRAEPRVSLLPLPGGVTASLARVLGVEPDGRPRVRLTEGPEAVAEWALPFIYEPAVGDQLWVVGNGEQVFVLGVAYGKGVNRVAVRGDLKLASGGTLRVAAGEKLRLVGETLHLRARALKVAARTIHVLTGQASTRVKGLLKLTAGRVQRITTGVESVTARRVVNLGADLVKIDAGESIGLG